MAKEHKKMSWVGIICWILVFLIVGGGAGYGTYATVKYFEDKNAEQSKVTDEEVGSQDVKLTEDGVVLYV